MPKVEQKDKINLWGKMKVIANNETATCSGHSIPLCELLHFYL